MWALFTFFSLCFPQHFFLNDVTDECWCYEILKRKWKWLNFNSLKHFIDHIIYDKRLLVCLAICFKHKFVKLIYFSIQNPFLSEVPMCFLTLNINSALTSSDDVEMLVQCRSRRTSWSSYTNVWTKYKQNNIYNWFKTLNKYPYDFIIYVRKYS